MNAANVAQHNFFLWEEKFRQVFDPPLSKATEKLKINVRKWLAAPGGTKFSKRIGEMSEEELNVCLTFLHVCEEERWHVFQKFIDELH